MPPCTLAKKRVQYAIYNYSLYTLYSIETGFNGRISGDDDDEGDDDDDVSMPTIRHSCAWAVVP